MSTSITKGGLLLSKNQAQWWLDKLLLITLCTIAWGLIAIRPPSGESIGVFHQGETVSNWIFGGRGQGRAVGNVLAYSLTWNPLGLVQPGQIILAGVLGIFIWKVLAQELIWVRIVFGGLFLFGFPYLPHGMDRPWACIFGPSSLMFGLFLHQVARGSQSRPINSVLIAPLVILLALSYETWMMFLFGVSIVTFGVKLAPSLLGRLQIHRMNDWQIASIGVALMGCFFLPIFFRGVL